MRNFLYRTLGLTLIPALVLAGTALIALPAAAEEEEGFISLFNGEDLEGWIVQGMEKAGPRVEDGVMVVGGWDYWAVITEEEFENFILRLEYMNEARGNSGILFHVPHEEVYKSTNLEIQITEEDVRNPAEATGAIFGLVEPAANPQKPADEWNTMEVRFEAPHLWVTINDVVVQDGIDITEIEGLEKELDKGSIAIQRNDYKRAVHFRNIRIKPLD
jgi:hypothetical protein